MAELCHLDRANAEAKKEIMGMRLLAYHAPAKAAIDLALPWHISTVQIAALNHDIRKGFHSTSNPAMPWGPKDHLRALAIIPIIRRATSLDLSLC